MLPVDVLRGTYGYDEFRGHQLAVITAACEGRDSLVLMPTGGGKSICYQIPALLSAGLGIVVSPLIALMHDQVSALRQLGIPGLMRAGLVRGSRAIRSRTLFGMRFQTRPGRDCDPPAPQARRSGKGRTS